jgi:hypothetical protein
MQHLNPLPPNGVPASSSSSAELVKEALAEAKHLIQLEVELAKEEIHRELRATKKAAISLSAGALIAVLSLALLLVSLALAIFPGPVPALVMGVVLMAAALLAVVSGLRMLPRKPLGQTLRRIEGDIESVKERV